MEITKIYSEPFERGGGRLYSVLLSEDELRFYSELQKEFGLKRKIISKIGHARVNLAEKIANSVAKDQMKGYRIGQAAKTALAKSSRIDPQMAKHLEQEAAKHNTKILRLKRGKQIYINRNNIERTAITSKELDQALNQIGGGGKKLSKNQARKVSQVVKGEHNIIMDSGRSAASEAHEVGHSTGYNASGSANNLITWANQKTHRQRGSIKPIKGTIADIANLAEEARASRKALNLLKSGGASKAELAQSKELLDTALDTNKVNAKIGLKSRVGNMLQIKSRRGKNVNQFYQQATNMKIVRSRRRSDALMKKWKQGTSS